MEVEDECRGKRPYDKKSAVTVVNKRYAEDHLLLRIYPCGDHWHVTKQLRGMRKFLKHGQVVQTRSFR